MKRVSRKILTTLVAGALVWLVVPAHGQAPNGQSAARAKIDAHFASRTQQSASTKVASAADAPPTAQVRAPTAQDNALLATMIGLVTTHDIGVIAGLIPFPPVAIPAEIAQVASDTSLKFTPPRLIAPSDLSVDSAGAEGPGYTVDGCGVEFELLSPRANYTNLFGVANFRDPYTRLNPFKIFPWKRFNDPEAVDTRWGYLRAPRLYHANTSVKLWLETPYEVRRYDQLAEAFGDPFVPIDSLAERPQMVYLPIGEHVIAWNAAVELNLVTEVGLPVIMVAAQVLSEIYKAYGGLKAAKQVKKSGIGDNVADEALEPGNAKRMTEGVDRFNAIWTEQFKARQARTAKNAAQRAKQALKKKFKEKVKKFVKKQVKKILKQLKKTGMNSIDGGTRDDLKGYLEQLPGYAGQQLSGFAPELVDTIWVVYRDKYPQESSQGVSTNFVIDRLDRDDTIVPILTNLVTTKGPEFAKFVLDLVKIQSALNQKGQLVRVLDSVPPTINFGSDPIEKEATDFGGTRLYRLRAELLANALAASSDNCGRKPNISLEAPALLLLGDTEVIFTARDKGPNPKDGQIYNPTFAQTVRIVDTQPPIMLAPPSKVVLDTADVPFSEELVGEAVAIDLVDVQPTVTNDAPANFPLNSRTTITWMAVDDSGNETLPPPLQVISVKSNNAAPEAFPTTASTETSKPMDILLSANDPDILDGIPDPLTFRIETLPRHGEFIAPLYPFFIEDYRTQPGDGLGEGFDPTDPANSTSAGKVVPNNFIDTNFCDVVPELEPPLNFAYNVKYVEVTDDGIRYLLDDYFECKDFNEGAAPFPRFSKWDADNNFLGQLDICCEGEDEPIRDTFRVDRDGFLYYNTVTEPGSSSNELRLWKCPVDGWPLDGGRSTSGRCVQAYKFDGPGVVDVGSLSYARIDSRINVAYVVDEFSLFAYELQENGGTRFLGEVGPKDEQGEVLDNWFGEIPSLEVGSDGAVYANDLTRHRIHKVDPITLDDDGEFLLGEYVGWSGQCNGSTTNACDLDLERSRGYFCTDATCTIAGSGAGSMQGQFDEPKYVSLDPNDVLYIADYNNSRIQRLSPDGTFAGEAVSEGTGINKGERPSFVIGNFGMPESVSVNGSQFFIVDRVEQFVNVFGTLPFKNVTDNSAEVTYVSNLSFPSPLDVDEDVFTFSVNDGLATSPKPFAEVRVTVSRAFRPPEALEEIITVEEDGSVDFMLPARDPDGIIGKDVLALDTLTYSLTRWPEHGTLSGFGEDWTYRPEPNYFGEDSLAFKVNDGLDDSNEATLTFDITAVNDAPLVTVEPLERIALGFPILAAAEFLDDAVDAKSADYLAGINWGDGQADITGEVTSDDGASEARLDGIVILPPPDLEEEGRAIAMHTYEATGDYELSACLQDIDLAEGCGTQTVTVESLVRLGIGGSFYATPLDEDEVTLQDYPDGQPFNFEMTLVNGEPSVGAGEVADDIVVDLLLPENLEIGPMVPEKGTCAREDRIISCAVGGMVPGEEVRLMLPIQGPGNLIYNEDRDFEASMTTASEAVSPEVDLTIAIELIADTTDTDADGMSDSFEETYGLNPVVPDGAGDADADGLSNEEEYELGTSPTMADTDGDGVPDLDEEQNGMDPLVDDNPPVLTIPADVSVNATGALTAVDLGEASAEDFKDGPVEVIATDFGPFRPGPNTVIWRAFDETGNKAEGFQFVNVVPLVNFIVDQTVAEGATARARVELNGSAVDYPVVVPFTVNGSATNPEDHDAAAGEIVIESGLSGTQAVSIAADLFDEPDETVVISMGQPMNAVAGVAASHTITISEQNQPPTVEIAVEQQGRPSTTIVNEAGLIAVLANLRDDPAQDHTFDWSGSAAGLFDPVTANDPSYLLDPSGLSAGLYNQRVDVVDNGLPPLGVNTTSLLRVEDDQLILRSDEDADGDSISDLEEGPDDNDGDRIPDYLDNRVNTNQLPLGEDGRALEAETGRLLRLGATAFSEASTVAGLPESQFGTDPDYGFANGVLDFEVLRVAQGGSAPVVVPLAFQAIDGSVYKRFVNGGWQEFTVGGGDLIESAAGTDGACPPAGAAAYQAGIIAGARCLQLTLTDGGPNDDDGVIDAVIRSVGGLATPVSAQVAPVSRRTVSLSGDGEAVAARYRIHSDSGDLEIRSVTIETEGSGDETLIDRVSLIVDQDRNGVFDDGDTLVADDQIAIDDGTLKLTLLEPYIVQPGDTDLLVVYRFGPAID